MEVDDSQFEKLITEVMDELPSEYIDRLDNVAITYEDTPTKDQRVKLKLRCNDLLFGLYEGVPRTNRGANPSFVLPDKITLFKQPIINISNDIPQVKANIKHTLWHEIAHYYGLDHDRIHNIEQKWRM